MKGKLVWTKSSKKNLVRKLVQKTNIIIYVIGDKITFTDSKYEATNGADCLAIMTEWNEFRNPDFGELKNQLNDNVIFDGRNLYDLDIVKDAGLAYLSIGRLPVNVALANNKVSI